MRTFTEREQRIRPPAVVPQHDITLYICDQAAPPGGRTSCLHPACRAGARCPVTQCPAPVAPARPPKPMCHSLGGGSRPPKPMRHLLGGGAGRV